MLFMSGSNLKPARLLNAHKATAPPGGQKSLENLEEKRPSNILKILKDYVFVNLSIWQLYNIPKPI